jgi:hypothetical protein
MKSHSRDVFRKVLRGEPGFRALCRACNSIMEPGAAKCVLHRSRFNYATRLHFHTASVNRMCTEEGPTRVDKP